MPNLKLTIEIPNQHIPSRRTDYIYIERRTRDRRLQLVRLSRRPTQPQPQRIEITLAHIHQTHTPRIFISPTCYQPFPNSPVWQLPSIETQPPNNHRPSSPTSGRVITLSSDSPSSEIPESDSPSISQSHSSTNTRRNNCPCTHSRNPEPTFHESISYDPDRDVTLIERAPRVHFQQAHA